MKIVHVILLSCTVCSVTARGGHGGHSSHGSHSSHGGHVSHGGYVGRSSPGSHHYFSHISSSHVRYTYHPPAQIRYTCRYCSSTSTYPVYTNMPPNYVYVYRESNNRYGDVLSGLALYNLGRMSSHPHSSQAHYRSQPEEKCSMQIIEKSHFEETEFPCFLMSTFVDDTDDGSDNGGAHVVDITSSQNVKPFLEDEGTASQSPLPVTNSQVCVLWHNLTTHKTSNNVPCALLKEYAETVKPSGVPVYVWLPLLLASLVAIYSCCYCFRKKKKESMKEELPLFETRPVGYSAKD